MITIHLLQNLSNNKTINKNTIVLSTITGYFKETTDIFTPTIQIQGDLANYVNCNYVHIVDFNRFYFVKNIRTVSKDIFELDCEVDVLMSFKQEILRQKCIIERNTSKWNLYINDSTFKVYANPLVRTVEFPSGFSDQHFVLIVAGDSDV